MPNHCWSMSTAWHVSVHISIPLPGMIYQCLKLLLGGFLWNIWLYVSFNRLGRDKMLETTNKTYHLSSAQDPQGGNCYSNQRPNRPITPTKNNPYCIGYDSPNSKKHRVSVPAHFTRSRGNPYPSCVRLRRLRRLWRWLSATSSRFPPGDGGSSGDWCWADMGFY